LKEILSKSEMAQHIWKWSANGIPILNKQKREGVIGTS
jgi:hypothetical protein